MRDDGGGERSAQIDRCESDMLALALFCWLRLWIHHRHNHYHPNPDEEFELFLAPDIGAFLAEYFRGLARHRQLMYHRHEEHHTPRWSDVHRTD